ncbi:BatA domain-containing protein [Deferrisoma sp.]
MDFLRPFFLWGLLAVLVPLVLHLLGRRRVRTVPVGVLRFLERARARAEARWRIRQWLLLAARMAALAALTLLYAGPGCVSEALREGPGVWFLVVDRSPSMGAAQGGRSAMDRAQEALGRVIARAGPEDRFWIVTTSEADDPAGPLPGREAQAAVRAIQPAPGRHDLGRALAAARGLAAGFPGARIAVVSDLQATAWPRGAGAGGGSEGAAPVFLLDCGWPAPANAWLGEVREGAGAVEVEVGRVGMEGRVTVRWEAPGRPERVAFLDPGQPTARYAREAEVAEAAISVEPGGDLAVDDRIVLPLRWAGAPRVLLVNGDPQGFEIRDELLFVRKAFAPGSELAERFRVREVRQADLRPEDLEGIDVVLVANPRPFSADVARAVEDALARGAAVVVSAGDHLIPEADLGAMLPAPLRDRIEVAQADPLRPPYESLDPASFTGFMAAFRDPEAGDLAETRVRRYWVLDTRSADGVRVWARFADGAPAILERAVGRGRVLFVATTLDRDGADLCLQAGFLPWLERLLLHAAGRLRPRVPAVVTAGEPLELPYGETVTLEGPDGGRTVWAPGDPPPVPTAVGPYRVITEGGVEDRFYARLPPAESDLRRLAPEEAARRLGAGARAATAGEAVGAGTAAIPGRTDASGAVAAALVAALLAEAALSARWRKGVRRDG